jgi:ATP-dependent Clp protease protease subunit
MAIYDRLRSLEGHTIKAEVIGECSSMASVVLMAASVRRMHPNARICIHKPRFADFYLPTMTEDEAKRAYEDLHAETERLKKIYLDRTSYTEEELDKLMGEDRYMTAEEALQHGVITEIIQPMTASKQPTTQHMSKLTKALRAFTQAMREGEKEQETQVVAMTLNTEDGSTIEIEREEGEPQVGDKVINTEDGEYKMADGTTIVIADGVITEIRPAEAEDNEDEAMTEEEVASTIAEMTEAIEKLTAENESLKAQLAASKANEKTAEDIKALSLVAMVGGIKGLESLKSKYNPASREVSKDFGEMSEREKMLAEAREKYKKSK